MGYGVALALTLVVEVPLVVVLLGELGSGVLGVSRWWPRAGLGVAVNLGTHPVLWWWLTPRSGLGALLATEAVVVVVEAVLVLIACRRRWRELGWALAVSGVANAASVFAGLVVGLSISASAADGG